MAPECIPVESEWSLDATVGIFPKEYRNNFSHDSVVNDDPWISSLLPLPFAPRSNRRKGRKIKEAPVHTGDQYKQAYQKISLSSTEPLTNDAWTARRLERERKEREKRRASYKQNQQGLHEGRQYVRAEDRRDVLTVGHETLMPEDEQSDGTKRNCETRPPRQYLREPIHRETMISRSRMAVSHAFRFVGLWSRRQGQSSSTSEATPSPTFVGRGGVTESNRPDRAGLNSFAGIHSRSRERVAIQALDGDDESDEDSAFWTTGTAMETTLGSDSFVTGDEVDSASLFGENQMMENTFSAGNEFVEWSHYAEGQEDGNLSEFPHNPFVQFNCSVL